MDTYLKCECHQCTWLRANQVERAFIPKPIECGDIHACEHGPAYHSPAQDGEVEKKPLWTVNELVEDIAKEWKMPMTTLWKLVDLARRGE